MGRWIRIRNLLDKIMKSLEKASKVMEGRKEHQNVYTKEHATAKYIQTVRALCQPTQGTCDILS